MSLRARILVLFTMFAVIPIVIVGVADYVQSIQALDSLVETRLGSLADHAATDLAGRYVDLEAAAGELAEHPVAWTFLLAESRGEPLAVAAARERVEEYVTETWLGRLYGADVIGFRAADGRVLHRVAPTLADDGLDACGPSGRVRFERPVYGLRGRDAIGAVVVEATAATLLTAEAMDARLGRSGGTVIVDRASGRVLFGADCGDAAVVLAGAQDRRGEGLEAGRLPGRRGSFRFGAGDSTLTAAFVNLDRPAWTVLNVASAQEFTVPYGRSRSGYLFFVIAVALTTSAAFSLLISRVMRSLEDLTRAAEKIGRGDFTPWLPPPGGDEVGRLSYALGVMVEKVSQMLRQVEQSRQLAAVGEFASYLSHEIRNPLSSIKLNLQGIARGARRGELPPDHPEVIETCLREIDRLDRVVHTMLRLGRPESGHREPASLHAVLDDAVDLLRAQLRRRRVRIECIRLATGDRVLVSGEQLKGVFLNLFLNAADAMPDGGKLRVWTENAATSAGLQGIRVHVVDDGTGIPPELRERMFQPFFTTKRNGSGIGLPLALRTVRDHGGDLYYDKTSELEPGAEFVVALPLIGTGDELPAVGAELRPAADVAPAGAPAEEWAEPAPAVNGRLPGHTVPHLTHRRIHASSTVDLNVEG